MESKRHAWTWNIKPEKLDEYVKMHLDVWPEVLDEHTKAGIQNYSIFQNGNQFFYCFECDDVKKAFAYIDNSSICQKWNAITSPMVEGAFDFGNEEPVTFLREVFYLE